MIEGSRGTALERKVWKFNCKWDDGYWRESCPISARLVYYGEETRATSRHKWRGEFWDSDDERRYHSRLKRPTEIPPDVLAEVIKRIREVPVEVYMGRFNAESLIATIKPGKGKPCGP